MGELELFSTFKISIRNYYKTVARICATPDVNINPDEIDNMKYFRFFYFVKDVLEFKEEQQKQQKKNNINFKDPSKDAKQMMANAKRQMPKLPKMK